MNKMWTPLETEYPCDYCGCHDKCYRSKIRFICALFKLIKNPCVLSKNSVIKKRKEYLDYDYCHCVNYKN